MRSLVSSFAVVLAILPGVLRAQDSAVTGRTCFRGRPLPTCRHFWITELEATVAGPGNGRDSIPRFDPRDIPRGVNRSFSGDVGYMTNRGPTRANGFLVHVGFDPEGVGRLAVKRRERVWAGKNSWDFDAGILQLNTESVLPFMPHSVYGVTTGAAYNFADFAAVTTHIDAVYTRQPRVATFAGVRLGSQPAAITSAAGAVLIGAFLIALVTGHIKFD